MFQKLVKLGIVLCVLLSWALASSIVLADDPNLEDITCQLYNEDEDMTVPALCDGRLNATDLHQPVAVYYGYEEILRHNEDDEPYIENKITGIEIWKPNWEGIGQLTVFVPLADIEAAQALGVETVLASDAECTLTYSPADNVFWLVVPAYNYSFWWVDEF